MSRDVVITGLGVVSGYGLGMDALWDGVISGKTAIDKIQSFDPDGFESQIASEVPADFKINKIVPKHYRKATKVMARDIALAVGAADAAVKDAGLITKGTGVDAEPTYPGERMGAQIGSMLIAADIDELAEAMVKCRLEDGSFDLLQWGDGGMENITPLWMLKFLPNMQACHVTILHDAQAPSNTLTCAEASAGLSLEESCRVIARNAADMCFCGGGDSKLNPMALLRWQLIGRLNTTSNGAPSSSVRPYDTDAAGLVIGEAGAILTVEAEDKANLRAAHQYARVIGHGATQMVHRESKGLLPEPDGKSLSYAINAALAQAGITAADVDICIGYGVGQPEYDRAEIKALEHVFDSVEKDPILWSSKPYVGNTGVSCGAIDIALACKIFETGQLPAALNTEKPITSRFHLGVSGVREVQAKYILVYSMAIGGQNTATVLAKI